MHEEKETNNHASHYFFMFFSLRDYVQVLAIIAGTAIVSMNKKVRESSNSTRFILYSYKVFFL